MLFCESAPAYLQRKPGGFFMSRRFQVLLDRYARIRRAIDFERHHPQPGLLRLVRLKRLQLIIDDRLRSFVAVRAIRRASRPRLVPVLVHSRNVNYRAR
jgi:hypothetical protein